MAKIHERKTRDLNQVKCIKEANRLLVKDGYGGSTLMGYSMMGTRALCPSWMTPLMTPIGISCRGSKSLGLKRPSKGGKEKRPLALGPNDG
jgi:hypothetical protein